MPPRAPHYCTGCNQLTANAGHCPACKDIGDRKRWARADAQRPPSSQRFTPGWTNTAAKFLRTNPVCAGCGAPATVADHTVRRRDLVAAGVVDPDAWHRLQPLCAPCHAVKTRTEIDNARRMNAQ